MPVTAGMQGAGVLNQLESIMVFIAFFVASMFDKLQSWLKARLSWRWFIGLALIMLISTLIFDVRDRIIGNPPDRQIMHFDAGFIQNFCCSESDEWSPKERMQLYIITQLTVDFIFPLSYSMAFGLALVAFYSRTVSRWLLVCPTSALLFDLMENFATIYLARTFDCSLVPPQIPWWTQAFTPCKWTFILAGIALTLCGFIIYLTDRDHGRTAK